jgi:hypothetical protein
MGRLQGWRAVLAWYSMNVMCRLCYNTSACEPACILICGTPVICTSDHQELLLDRPVAPSCTTMLLQPGCNHTSSCLCNPPPPTYHPPPDETPAQRPRGGS